MDLDLSAEDLIFRDGLRTWLARHVPRAWRRRPRGLEPAGDAPVDELKTWQRKLHRAGYVGIGWPREHGGRGASLLQQAILDEELARHHVPQLIGYAGVAMLGPTLIAHGTADQQRRFLPPILTADAIWCQGYSEPGAGSDLAALRTSAVRDGDDFVVNGQKVWTSNAHLADWMFCLVRTDPSAPKHRGISYLLVDMHQPGITVRPLVQMTKDAQFNEVFLEDVCVPVANAVGGLGNGWTVANTTLVHERRLLGNPAHTQNLFAGVVRLARRAARTSDPVVRQRLAELKIDVEAMRYHHYRGLTAEIAGKPLGVEANVTKLATTWLNHRLAETALELLGPDGLRYRGDRHAVDDGFWPYELMFSLGMIIGGGTSQIQKNIIAQRGLGLPRGMNFALSDEQEQLAAAARAQLARACPPSRVREIMATPAGWDPALHRTFVDAGWAGVVVPEALGGTGLTMLDAAVVLGELGRAVVPGPFLVSQIAAVTALRAVRSRRAGASLARLASGNAIATVALDDPLRAKRVRGGEHQLDGHARFVDYAHVADVILVAASDTLFAVPRATRGVTASPLVTVDETRRPCDLRLRAVRLPAEACLGRVPAAIARARDAAAVAIAAESLGGAERALELAVEYVKVREQFGRAVGSFQAVQHMAAEAVARIEPARALLWYAAWAFDARPREASLAASMAKARCTDVFREVARTSIEMHGGIGFTWEHDIHLYWKRALANWSLFGDAHAQRERIADLARW